MSEPKTPPSFARWLEFTGNVRTRVLLLTALALPAPWAMAQTPQSSSDITVAAPQTAPTTAPSVTQPSPVAPSADAQTLSPAQTPLVPGVAAASSTSPAAGATTYLVPAGTKVLLTLQASVNTKSAKPGDGLYLQSAFPVIVGNRVLIPAGMYVQGIVDGVDRPIRIKGHAQLKIHFTSMIFPNGSVVEIPGVLNSIPGSKGPKVRNGGEGTVEQSGNKGDVAKSAGKGAVYGAGGGVLVGSAEGSALKGVGYGGLAGAVVGSAVSLFTHGNDIDIPAGSQVEMVLQRPLLLQDSNLTDPTTAPPQQALVPAPQRGPMPKPVAHRILCPTGSCQ